MAHNNETLEEAVVALMDSAIAARANFENEVTEENEAKWIEARGKFRQAVIGEQRLLLLEMADEYNDYVDSICSLVVEMNAIDNWLRHNHFDSIIEKGFFRNQNLPKVKSPLLTGSPEGLCGRQARDHRYTVRAKYGDIGEKIFDGTLYLWSLDNAEKDLRESGSATHS